MNDTKVIAVPELPQDAAGAIAFWRLTGAISHAKLMGMWLDDGLDERLLPELPSPTVALHRAMEQLQERRRLIRPLGRGAGWAVVQEQPKGDDDLGYNLTVRAKLDAVGHLVIEPEDSPLKGQIVEQFNYQMGTLTQSDVSSWLCTLVNKLSAVPLRETGGVYFIPRGQVAVWKRMAAVLEGASGCVVHEIPALQSADAVAAILDALAHESAGMAKTMKEDIQKLGERGLKARMTECEAYEVKIEMYEKLLGQHQQALHDRLQSLKAAIATAILVAGGGDDDAAVADAGTL